MKLKGSQVVRIWEEIQRLKENVGGFGLHHATEDFVTILTEEILTPFPVAQSGQTELVTAIAE